MKKSKRKIRDPREVEKTFRIEYKSSVDTNDYWTLIHARSEEESKVYFNELYGSDRAKCEILDISENE